MTKEYYETLDVPEDATQDEIKKSYRKKAQKLHPDKDNGNEDEFKDLQEAYLILSDKDKRKRYDSGENVHKREPTLQEKANSKFAQLIDLAVHHSNDHTDMVLAIKKAVACEKESIKADVSKATKGIEKLEHILGRVTYTGEQDNMFAAAIALKVNDRKHFMEVASVDLKILDIVDKLLVDYKCKIEEQQNISATIYRTVSNTYPGDIEWRAP